MDEASRRAISKCKNFLRDVDYDLISGTMLSEKLVTVNEHQSLQKAEDDTKIKLLVNILPSKGPKAFDKLISVLNLHYDWVSTELSKCKTEEEEYLKSNPESLEHIFRRNGCPNLSKILIGRCKEETKLEGELIHLKPQNCLVICGSFGCGKSVLANLVVRTESVRKKYYSGIYWIEGAGSQANILAQVNSLLDKMRIKDPDIPEDTDINQLLLSFANIIRSQSTEDSILIVLNDIQDKATVKAFADVLGCSILITTRNTKLEPIAGRCQYLSLSDGMNLTDAKQLLSKWTDTPTDKLPHIAAGVIKYCHGSPLLLSLIGFKIQTNNREDRWEHYFQILSNDLLIKNKLSAPDYHHDSVMSAFESSLSLLDNQEKELFSSLVVFKSNTVINSKVLRTLWNLNKSETEMFAEKLSSVSLLHEEWNKTSKRMEYRFRSLIHKCLSHFCDDIKKYHSNLINNYINSWKSYKLIPDDGYIHKYWMYHLYKAKNFSLLAHSTVDLEFLEKRIKLVNSLTVLQDIIEYQDLIEKQTISETCVELDNEVIRDLRALLQIHGHDLNMGHSLVQLALSFPPESQIFKIAFKIARKEYNHMNLTCSQLNKNEDIIQVVGHDSNISCGVFIDDGSKLLLGENSGNIQLCWAVGGKAIMTFIGHSKTITEIAVNRLGHFVSSSKDGTVRLWHLAKDGNITPEYDDNTPHEKFRRMSQISTEMFWENESIATVDSHETEVMTCDIHPTSCKTLSGDNNGMVLMCDFDRSLIKEIDNGHTPVICCRWCLDDCIAIGFTHSIVIKKNDGTVLFKLPQDIVGLVLIDTTLFYCCNKKSLNKVTVHDSGVDSDGMISVDLAELHSSRVLEVTAITGIHPHHCETPLIAVSTNECEILLLDARKFVILRSYKGHEGIVKYVTFSPKLELGIVLMSITEEIMKFWKVDLHLEVKNSVPGAFCVKYKKNSLQMAIAEENGFQIFTCNSKDCGSRNVYSLSRVTFILLLDDFLQLIYGCENGNIMIHDFTQSTSRSIYRHNSQINYMYCQAINLVLSISSEGHLAVHILEGDGYNTKLYKIDVGGAIQLSKPHSLFAWSCRGKFCFVNIKTNYIKLVQLNHEVVHDLTTVISPCKRLMVVFSPDLPPELWNLLPAFEKKTDLKVEGATCASFSYNSSLVGIGNSRGRLYLWKTSSLSEVPIVIEAYTTNITSFQFDKSLSHVVTSGPYVAWHKIPSKKPRRHHFSGPSRSENGALTNTAINQILYPRLHSPQGVPRSGSFAYMNGSGDPVTMDSLSLIDGDFKDERTPLKRMYDCIRGDTLLQSHPIHGQVLKSVQASEEFDSFVGIDDLGVIYTFWEVR